MLVSAMMDPSTEDSRSSKCEGDVRSVLAPGLDFLSFFLQNMLNVHLYLF